MGTRMGRNGTTGFGRWAFDNGDFTGAYVTPSSETGLPHFTTPKISRNTTISLGTLDNSRLRRRELVSKVGLFPFMASIV